MEPTRRIRHRRSHVPLQGLGYNSSQMGKNEPHTSWLERSSKSTGSVQKPPFELFNLLRRNAGYCAIAKLLPKIPLVYSHNFICPLQIGQPSLLVGIPCLGKSQRWRPWRNGKLGMAYLSNTFSSDFNCIFDSIPLGNPPYLLVSHLPVCFLKADIVTFILFPIR